MAKFVVDRRTWLRGAGSDPSALLTDDGQRCCLGFVAQQCGVSDHCLKGVRTPRLLKRDQRRKLPSWFFKGDRDRNPEHSSSCRQAMMINDDIGYRGEGREARIREIFAANGDEIEFIN